MNVRSKGLIVFSTLIILSMVLAACAPAAPETIIQTVEVMVEGTPVVQTQVVEVTSAAPVEEEEATGPILAEEGLVACNPIPVLPEAASYIAPVTAPKPVVNAPKSIELAARPQQGGAVYRVGVFEDVTTTNYWAANGPDNTVYNSYMLPERWTLYELSDKFFTFVPMAATNCPVSWYRKATSWTVTIPLRDDVMWSDGTPFTANDVAWTANTVMKLGLISGNWSSWYDSNYLQGMEVVDDYTVKDHLPHQARPGPPRVRHPPGSLS